MRIFDSKYLLTILQEKDNTHGSGTQTDDKHDKDRRGFASMDPEKQHKIAKQGGEARKEAAQRGDAPSYQEIGREGGQVRKEMAEEGESMSFEEMGKKGGQARSASSNEDEEEE